MMRKRRLLAGIVTGAVLYARRRDLARIARNLHTYSAPSAGLYDVLAARVLDGFFERIALEVAALPADRRILEVGSGPGHLALKLARTVPGTRVTGIDIAPDMVERARARASREGAGSRVEFRAGDAALLPFADASFDVVLSTFSLHHWSDQAAGLAEIHRVLAPGGVAWLYDVAGWIARIERRGPRPAELAAASPFGDGRWAIVSRIGPVPLAGVLRLTR